MSQQVGCELLLSDATKRREDKISGLTENKTFCDSSYLIKTSYCEISDEAERLNTRTVVLR
jgi:hypothetical protein